MSLLRRRKVDPVASAPVIDCTPISSISARQRVCVVGEVTRMRSRPTTGQPSLVVTVADESGTVQVVWTGRRSIGGISLGRKVAIQGVACHRGSTLEFTNPTYTLLPR